MSQRSWRHGVATALEELKADRVSVTDEHITMYLVDGRFFAVPLHWSWRLERATPEQRANWRVIGDGYGFHWPDVDEDLSVHGMVVGSPAPRPGPDIFRYLVTPPAFAQPKRK